jgi:hypothetical protein
LTVCAATDLFANTTSAVPRERPCESFLITTDLIVPACSKISSTSSSVTPESRLVTKTLLPVVIDLTEPLLPFETREEVREEDSEEKDGRA